MIIVEIHGAGEIGEMYLCERHGSKLSLYQPPTFIQSEYPLRIPTKKISFNLLPQPEMVISRCDTGVPCQLWEVCPEHNLFPTNCISELNQFLLDILALYHKREL